MITYAEHLTSPHGAQGIASYPWQWLVDLKPITYLRVNPSLAGDSLNAITPVSAFFGMISPPILALAIPSLFFCAWRVARRRPVAQSFADVQLAILGIAWFIGTWLPYQLQSALDSRTSYLYYMIVVMPGIYLSVTYLVALGWRTRNRWLQAGIGLWGATVLSAAILMFPFVAVF
jgi:hypothetical protein